MYVSREEVREIKMVKVEELIETLAEQIIETIKSKREAEHEISEKTKALADLLTARALMN